jgi:hypothetical protein
MNTPSNPRQAASLKAGAARARVRGAGRDRIAIARVLDNICPACNITRVAWDVERTDEFTQWWERLSEDEQVSVSAIVTVLSERGPNLKRPYVGKLERSKLPNLKELIIQHRGDPYRVLFAFDPRKTAILLLGGKKGAKGWYVDAIAKAEKLYSDYLKELKKEGLI